MNQQHFSIIAALAAGNYAATGELARLIGEQSGFKVQFHEGGEYSLYLAEVFDDYFLVVIFGKQTSFGMVRVLASAMTPKLVEVLTCEPETHPYENGDASTAPAGEFREELASKLDGLFGKKSTGD